VPFLSLVAGDDYILVVDELTFTPTGGIRMCTDVSIIDDHDTEGNEFFMVSLSQPSQSTATVDIGVPSTAIVTIVDDDSEYPDDRCDDCALSIVWQCSIISLKTYMVLRILVSVKSHAAAEPMSVL